MSVQTVDHFFNPSSKEFIHDPVPTLEKLCAEFPISRFDTWQAWLVTGHANIIKCLLDTRLSTDFNLWEFAPPKKPVEEMDAFEKLMNNNLFFLDRKNHLRLRKLALPAFSPRIMEQMKERFTVLVKERFDIVLDRRSFFEDSFQKLIKYCNTENFKKLLLKFDGYDVSDFGKFHYIS